MAGKKKPDKSGDDLEDAVVDKLTSGREEPPEQDDDDKDSYEVGAEDDDDDEEEPRPSRRERRRERGNTLLTSERERAERAERAAEEARREAAETRALLNRQLVQGQPQQERQQENPEHARLDREYDEIDSQLQQITDQYESLKLAKALTPEKLAELQKRNSQLRRQQMDNRIQRNQQPAQQQLTPQQLAAFNNQQRLMQDHGDVVNHPVAQHYFTAEFRRLSEGKQPDVINIDWEKVGQAAARARELAKLPPKGGRPAPTAGQRAKFSGVSRGSSGGGGDAPQTMKMTPRMKALAKERYPYEKDERKRNQRFVNEHANKPSFRKSG